jgi:WD40 repeat protein
MKKLILVISLVSQFGVLSAEKQGTPPSSTVETSEAPDEIATGIMEKPIYPMGIHTLDFSPDGKTLASGDGTGHLRLWEARTGKLLHDVTAHSNWVFAIEWARDGSKIITGGGDNMIHWFDAEEPALPIRTLRGHSNDVHAVALTKNGKTLYSAGDDRQMLIWDARESLLKKRIRGHDRQIPALELSPNERLVATGSRDRSIKIWNKDGELRDTLIGHTGDVVALSFSRDGSKLASAGWDNTARIWNVRTGKAERIIAGNVKHVSGVAFSEDSKRIAVSGGSRLGLFELATGKQIWSANFGNKIRDAKGTETAEDLSAVAFGKDDELIAVGSTTGAIYLMSADTGKMVRQLSPPARNNLGAH